MSTPIILPANPAIGSRGDLHLYLPPTSATLGGPHPFIVAIHGGGWKSGDQTSYQQFLDPLAPLGVAVVLVSYRLLPEHPFPAAYDDLIHTLRWLKENAEEHQLDASRCGLIGSSAGGHLTMLLASRGIAEHRQALPTIRAVAEYCGIMDLTDQYRWDQENTATLALNFMQGQTPEQAPKLYHAASPIEHLHADMPPLWITHGSADRTVPYAQSLALAERLRELKHDFIIHEARGLDHTFRETTPTGEPLAPTELLFQSDLQRFFARHLLR